MFAISVDPKTGQPLDHYHSPIMRAIYASVYISSEAWDHWMTWCLTPSRVDAHQSGIFADWIDDHRDHFTTDDPAVLDKLTGWLRERFVDPTRGG